MNFSLSTVVKAIVSTQDKPWELVAITLAAEIDEGGMPVFVGTSVDRKGDKENLSIANQYRVSPAEMAVFQMVNSIISNRMKKKVLTITLGYLVITASGLPITGDEDLDIKSKVDQPENIDQLNKVLENVAYVNNFKNMMAGYVKEKYQNLTIIDMEKIKDILEDFCHQFAKDLKEVLQQDSVVIKDNVDDGIPEATFYYIRQSIKNEYPLIKENKADEVMLVLRRDLLDTRQKIDRIIKERSEIEP